LAFGPNGAGKSTFFKTLKLGENPDGIKRKPNLKIGYLPQEGDLSQVSDLTLKEFLEKFSDIVAEEQEWDFNYSLLETAKNIFFGGKLSNTLKNLSGGEKTKLQMLILLLRKADLILLDEPTNHIDSAGQILLTRLIESLSQGGTSFITSSHNPDFLEQNSVNGSLKITVTENERKIKEERKYKLEEATFKSSYSIPWLSETSFKGTILETRAEIDIFNQKVELDKIESGDKVILVGENGSGKSTILRSLINPKYPRIAGGASFAYLPQEWPREVLQGNLGDFLKFCKVDDQNFNRTLERSGFRDRRPVGTEWLREQFSGFSLGEQRFLWFLATSAGGNPGILILDEPTNHLDQELKKELTEAIVEFKGAVLVVTHDRFLMEEILGQSLPSSRKKFWVLEKGLNSINTHTQVYEYFGRLARKAEQSVKQLDLV